MTTHPVPSAGRDGRDALTDAVRFARAGLARGSALPVPRRADMERRQSNLYIAHLALRLPEDQVEALSRATIEREAGLASARHGQMEEAQAHLEAAARIVLRDVSTEEGRLSAASYQAAAVAFLHHKQGRFDAADSCLHDALVHCRRLREEFGHPVEVRRVHLARNLVRVRRCAGGLEPSLRLLAALLRYVWEDDAEWPVSEQTDLRPDDRSPLRADERWALTDQLLCEAADWARTAWQSSAPDAVVAVLVRCDQPRGAALGQLSEVLRLLVVAASGPGVAAVDALGRYFEQGSRQLPMTWEKLVRLLEEIEATSSAWEAVR